MKRKKSEYIILVSTLIIISTVTIFISTLYEEDSLFVKNFSNYFLIPIEKLFLYSRYSVFGVTGCFDSYREIKIENDRLTSLLKSEEYKNEQMKALINENKMLRNILALKDEKPDFECILADVISRDSTNFHKVFTINKGIKDNLKVNQIILTVDYVLLGRICEVGNGYSKVLTLFNEKNALGARVVRSLEPGVIENDGKNDNYKMSAISKFSDIILGDLIETSGLGGVYPEGMLIGKVLDIKTEVGCIAQTAIIEPSSDINKIIKVLIRKE